MSPSIPSHVAIIMDGNGRWAEAQHLPRRLGHKRGAENLYAMAKWARERAVRHLTVYAFSTENWQRSQAEVNSLLQLLPYFLDRYEEEIRADCVAFRFFGNLERLPSKTQKRVRALVEATSPHTQQSLNICFSYGGRDEIVRAVRELAVRGLDLAQLTEEQLGSALDSRDLPDPELLIRTGGELRLSNFLLWQSAYTEFYFTDCLWPDFGPEEFERALRDYAQRQRRFGRRHEEVTDE